MVRCFHNRLMLQMPLYYDFLKRLRLAAFALLHIFKYLNIFEMCTFIRIIQVSYILSPTRLDAFPSILNVQFMYTGLSLCSITKLPCQ